MKVNYIRIAGFILILLAILILFTIVEYDFPIFKYAGTLTDPSVELVEEDVTKIGQEVSRFLWNYRVIDLIAQAFVLFAAATCCVAILRIDEEKS
jgi:hypothetical protein